ncbi:hypothetical protein WS76_09435 [Burkholderia humptydooensis]|nr:hypothetical protein WS76_09435 [Burkholderia humptydooensis]
MCAIRIFASASRSSAARRPARRAPRAAARVFGRNEIRPLQARFAELNDWLGDEVVTFDDYEIPPAPVAAS